MHLKRIQKLLQAQKEASRQGLAKPKSTTFLVYLKKQATLASLCSTSNIQTRRQLIVARLQATAQRSQAGLIPLLESNLQKGHISRYKSYWIFNGFVVDGDLHAALELARRRNPRASPDGQAVFAEVAPGQAPGAQRLLSRPRGDTFVFSHPRGLHR